MGKRFCVPEAWKLKKAKQVPRLQQIKVLRLFEGNIEIVISEVT